MFLSNWGVEQIQKFTSAENALIAMLETHPDLVLLDINLSGQRTGLDFAQKINHLQIPIIYMTGRKDEDTYSEAKSTNMIAYLVKPFDEITLKGALDVFLKSSLLAVDDDTSLEAHQDHIFVRKGSELVKLVFQEIEYIKSDGNYCYIYYSNGKKYMVKIALKSLLKYLPTANFIQIHRSYIIDIKKIISLELTKGELNIADITIPIGRAYKSDLLDRITILKERK